MSTAIIIDLIRQHLFHIRSLGVSAVALIPWGDRPTVSLLHLSILFADSLVCQAKAASDSDM